MKERRLKQFAVILLCSFVAFTMMPVASFTYAFNAYAVDETSETSGTTGSADVTGTSDAVTGGSAESSDSAGSGDAAEATGSGAEATGEDTTGSNEATADGASGSNALQDENGLTNEPADVLAQEASDENQEQDPDAADGKQEKGTDAADDYSFGTVADESIAAMLEKVKQSDAWTKDGLRPATGDDTWTVAIYMCGSDLERDFSFGSNELREMLLANIPHAENDKNMPEKVNLIIMTGGAGENGWHWNNEDITDDASMALVNEDLDPDTEGVQSAYTQPHGTQIWQVTDEKMNLLYTYDEYQLMNDGGLMQQFFEFAADYAPAEPNYKSVTKTVIVKNKVK